MNSVELDGVSISLTLGKDLRAVSLSSEASRIALVGDWSAFFDYLMGNLSRNTGRVLFLGEDARQSVIQGAAAVVHPALSPPWKETVGQWLTDQLRLLSHSAPEAKRRVSRTLTELELDFLSGRKLGTLNPVESFAVQIASASMTEPRLIAVAQTPALLETAAYERLLLDRVAQRARLLLGCDPAEQMDLFLSCQEAWFHSASGSVRAQDPMATFAPGRSYQISILRNARSLESKFLQNGVLVHNPGSHELYVSLPDGTDTTLLVQLAAESDAPLSRMLPLKHEE